MAGQAFNVMVNNRWYEVWRGSRSANWNTGEITSPACIQVTLLDWASYGLTREQATLLTVKESAKTLSEVTTPANAEYEDLMRLTNEEIVAFALNSPS